MVPPTRATTAVLVVAALAVGACSGDDEPAGDPPATRPVVTAPADTDPEVTGPAATDLDDGGTRSTESGPDTTIGPPDATIEWTALSDRVDEGWLTVPLDYDDPGGETIDLYVTRHRAPADERVGALLTNPGGPGVAASGMAIDASSWFEPALIERFDIVAWDPRGTGASDGAVDCIDDDDYDVVFASSDPTPETRAERDEVVELARSFAEGCVERVGDVLPHVGTNNSARDMDAIRRALGEEQVSYLGFSYGSELGAVWATLFPDTVRAAVLDGASDPTADGIETTKQQWIGFERSLNTFLAECSADTSCEFHNDGDAEGAFDALLADLDDEPVPTVDGRPDLNMEVAINGVIQAMYSDRFWPALERALADAQAGDGAGLLALHDAYFRRAADGTYGNLLEAFQAITCADDPDRFTVAEADERAEELIGAAPRLFPYTTGSYGCTFFPESADPRIEVTGERAGPIVVIGTTGDPSTPLESSAAMAAELDDGRLVVVEANRHTAYRSGACINDVVHDYLIWLTEPAPDARCG